MSTRPPVRRGRRGIAALVSATILLTPFSADRAEAETIILKDGTKVPCRILLEGEEEVVVRIAGGMEVSYKKKDIARIDRSVSSIEIYEAVAERIAKGDLTAALYLGHWCLENGLENEARRFFKIATRDRAVVARAHLASAKLAGSAAEKRALFAKAVVADPSLEDAVDALALSGPTLVELPEDLLGLGSQLFRALPHRNAKDVMRYLSAVERYPAPEARAAYAERFSAFTGLSFEDIRRRCGARGGKSSRSRSLTDDGKCRNCKNTGYTRCPICEGKGYKLCRTCRGKGTKTVKKHSSRLGSRSSKERCPTCRGVGGHDCRACARLPDGPRKISKSLSTQKTCAVCQGTGRVKTATPSTYTRTSYASTTICPACRGIRKTSESHLINLTITSSGKRRCVKCNTDGAIPLSGHRTTPTRDRTPHPVAVVAGGTGIFKPEERTRLMAMREVFATARTGASLRWQAGPRIPFSFAAAEEGEEDGREVFAFGQWCTPSMRNLKARMAKALGYKPRDVDVSEFNVWMRDQELAYLSRRSKPIGRGGPGAGTDEPCADDVKALVAALECARRAGVAGGVEHSTIMRTTFSPGPSRGGGVRGLGVEGRPPLVCRLDTSARGMALVLLRDTASWPASEVVLVPLPHEQSGFDFGAVTRAIRRAPQALTLYYRIRTSCRETAGRGLDAAARVILSADVLAATLGSARKPTKVWLREAITP